MEGIFSFSAVEKPLQDTRYTQMEAHRYECLKCGRTFRVYPRGVSRAQKSLRVKGLAVMLYLLGLTYISTEGSVAGLGSFGRVYVQEWGLRRCTGHSGTGTWIEERKSLWRTENAGLGR